MPPTVEGDAVPSGTTREAAVVPSTPTHQQIPQCHSPQAGQCSQQAMLARQVDHRKYKSNISLATHFYTLIKPLFESSASFQSVSLLLQKHEDNCKTTKQQRYRYLLIPSLMFTQTILQYHREIRKKTCTQSVCINGSLFEAWLVSAFQYKT